MNFVKEEYQVQIKRCREGGVAVEECWRNRTGVLHREHNAAKIIRDPETGRITRTEFWKRGLTHRFHTDGPAVEEFDPASGACIYRAWMDAGSPHRENDLPAIEHLDPASGTVIRAEFFHLGHRHRNGGPAIVVTDPTTSTVTQAEWYQRGQRVSAGRKPDRSPQ